MKKMLCFFAISLCLCGCVNFYANNPSGEYDLYVAETTLASVYKNNELDGNKRYFGKRIKTSSTVESVSSGMFSGIMVFMDKIYCSSFNTEEDEAKLSDLNKGQFVTVIGTVDTWESSKLNLTDCEIF